MISMGTNGTMDATRGRLLRPFALASLAIVFATVASFLLFGRERIVDVVMIYLLAILLVALRSERAPSIFAAVLGVVAFDFFFVPPYYSFSVADLGYVTTFAVMFVVATVVSHLAQRGRQQAERARKAELEITTERLRNSLLSSVSHDLRTPLAIMKGAASTLAQGTSSISQEERRDLALSIVDEADRLNRLVRNLLDMTRLEAGVLPVKREWQSVEEVVGGALARLEEPLRGRPVRVHIPRDLPLVPFDPVLIEQVLINLVDNAARYSAPGTELEVSASANDQTLTVEIADRGPGLPPDQEEKIFEKFHRAFEGRGGIGLGLAICRGIVEAHGGVISAKNREGGGSVFRFTLPLGAEAPSVTSLERQDKLREEERVT